ncbi:MAG TPA: AraC family transcriptional regulator [Firmicutes bacterium]|jgi:AraC-like DNA-binding protein|nr:AraC family transcriptional regulator [Bacillota bacterium]
MLDIFFTNEQFTTDLNLYHCGIEPCKPGHSYGPAVRDHYLFHYILSGKGSFFVNNQHYALQQGQGFLIYPELITYYEADQVDPWHYVWVGFNGLKVETYLEAAGFSRENPILTQRTGINIDRHLLTLVHTAEEYNNTRYNYGKTLHLQGLLYITISEMIENAGPHRTALANGDLQDVYIRKALEFIKTNYSRPINIKMIAASLGLSRSYLTVLFKNRLQIGPQDYLIQFRMERACDFLRNPLLSIGDVARSVGYSDPLAFSKIFKKVKGLSPSQYRQNHQQAQKGKE